MRGLLSDLVRAWRLSRATTFFSRGRYTDAVEHLEAILAGIDSGTAGLKRPTSEFRVYALVYLGRTYLELGRFDEAATLLASAYEDISTVYRRTPSAAHLEFLAFLEAFADSLERTGDVARASAVRSEIKAIRARQR